MTHYSHTQRAGGWIWILAGMALVFVLVALVTRLWPVLLGIPVLAVILWLFGSLTVVVDDRQLMWRFGPGLVRGSLARSEILRAEPVKTTWLQGWGIHYTRHGWLYNVAGFDAVALKLRDGRRLAVGTDEPDRLLAALALAPSTR